MEWKEQEDTLLEKMKDFQSQMVDMRAEVKELKGTLGNSNISNLDQLTKFDFKGKIDDLCEKFQEGTRQWFFDELSSWFADEKSRVMILSAGPGIGKSVLSAKVCQDYSKRGKLARRHFCDFRKSNYSKPSNILQSLASQMCDNVDGFSEKLTEILGRNHSLDSLSDAFTVLLNEPLHAFDRHEPMLIVVDALDESKTDGKSEFLELISDEFPDLPKWIKILITSRPELQVQEKLEHFHPLEILPKDNNQQDDIKCFVKNSLPHFTEVYTINNLVWKCEGSFLYAYYMVNEVKDVDVGIDLNLQDYAPRSISGFYEKQFKRLRKGLQPGIFNGFVNVIAASRAPLPIKIILKCMNLSDEDYETRSIIINIMSEILPVHDNCLTVYHKSLIDWLTLEGYEEHAFVADVDDGTKRLWEGCKSVYRDIVSVKSESDFELSPERMFALENGGNYLVNVRDTADFHWLVDVKLNALKFRFCGRLDVEHYHILNHYKSTLSHNVYWRMFQHYSILEMIREHYQEGGQRSLHCFFLQSIANGHFQFATKGFSSQTQAEYFCDEAKEAKHILDDANEIWLEQLVNFETCGYEVIANNIFSNRLNCLVSSPDNKLVVCARGNSVKVLKLPNLVLIFELNLGREHDSFTFAPDSSYFLYNSITSCVCIAKKK